LEKRGVHDVPKSIDKTIIESFKARGIPTPKEHPNLLDWSSPLTSGWNYQAIYLLCSIFKEEIEKGDHPQVVINLHDYPKDQLVKWCTVKLRRTQKIYHDNMAPLPSSQETAEEKSVRVKEKRVKTLERTRRVSRKTNVCYAFITNDKQVLTLIDCST
jgi:hypothetical protein